MSVHLSDEAEADLEAIWLKGALDFGVMHAERVTSRCAHVFALLDEFPNLGAEYDALLIELRHFHLGRYPFQVFYTRVPDGIRIIRILHDKMSAPEHMPKSDALELPDRRDRDRPALFDEGEQ